MQAASRQQNENAQYKYLQVRNGISDVQEAFCTSSASADSERSTRNRAWTQARLGVKSLFDTLANVVCRGFCLWRQPGGGWKFPFTFLELAMRLREFLIEHSNVFIFNHLPAQTTLTAEFRRCCTDTDFRVCGPEARRSVCEQWNRFGCQNRRRSGAGEVDLTSCPLVGGLRGAFKCLSN